MVTQELVLDLPDHDAMLTLSDSELETGALRLVRQEDYGLTLVVAKAEPID